jgi:Bifunctional DNA primase/polymerase, N-terminal
MDIPQNNPRSHLFRRLSRASDTEAVSSPSPGFSQLPDYVLLAASRGWQIFPTAGQCWVEGIGVADATSDLTQIGEWTNNLEGFYWSLATGPKSGVFVLEVEEPDGLRSLRRLSQTDWTETLYTRSRFYMVAFWRYPAGMRPIDAGRIEIAPGLAVRADGESVVLPPQDSGRWPDPDAPVLESPEWLVKCAFRYSEPTSPIRETRRFTLIRGGLYRAKGRLGSE